MSKKHKQYIYYETLDKLIADTVDNPGFKEEYTVSIWKRYLKIITKKKVYTHNEIKRLNYSPEEISLKGGIKFKTDGRGLLYPFLTAFDDKPYTEIVKDDIFFRKYTHLPLAWIDWSQKSNYIKDVVQLDVNKMYISVLLNSNPYFLSPEYNKVEEIEGQGMYYIRARVKNAKTKKLPIVQPLLEDVNILDEILNSSSSSTLPENGIVYLLHAIQPDNKIYSTYNYFLENYNYENIEILEIHHQLFLENKIFENLNTRDYEIYLDTVIKKAHNLGEGRLKLENKLELAMMLGKMFPKPIITGDYLRTNYTWNPEIKKFDYDYKENENPKFEVKNRIYQVPYLYLILQDYVFNTFGPHFEQAYHIGADSIIFPISYYNTVKEMFPLGDRIGMWKKRVEKGLYMFSPKNYCFYDENQKITGLTLSGVSREDKEKYLLTLDDFINQKHHPFKRGVTIEHYLNRQRTYTKDIRQELHTTNPYNFPDLEELPDKALVLAPARTGKTTFMLNTFKEKKILHLFYNKIPQLQVKEKAEDIYNNANYEVRTLDSWIQQNYPGKSRSYRTMRLWFIANIDKMTRLMNNFDHIIIDEVQSNYGLLAEIVILLKNKLTKITLLGDFDQQLEKVRRDSKKLTLDDFEDIPKFRLNTNFMTPQKVAQLAESYISTSVNYISSNEGNVRNFNVPHKKDLVNYIKQHGKRYGMIICRHKQLRDELVQETGTYILSVSQSLSWDAEDVLLIGSTKLNPIMDEYEQRLEIKNAIMRSTNTIDILEIHD